MVSEVMYLANAAGYAYAANDADDHNLSDLWRWGIGHQRLLSLQTRR